MQRKPFDPSLISVPPDEKIIGRKGPITVTQLTCLVKEAIEASLPATVHVVGELSNFKRHSSGHLYFTLKDRSSELSCVMWRSSASKMKFSPTDGLEVVATGHVEVFERVGRYQLYVRKLEPRGVGALELAFRQLFEKLEREGLFNKEHKQPIPRYPSRIVLVTSPTGAAVADMIRTIHRRFPCVRILVYPVRVQGPVAAGEIAAAIGAVNVSAERLGGVDVVIVGRGGGALEDLWAFNEEVVARAIFASRIPIISAVGHEVDVSISDMVADLRAATPTAAGELAVPVLGELLDDLELRESRLARELGAKLQLLASSLVAVTERRAFREPLLTLHRREQVMDECVGRMHRKITEYTHLRRRVLDRLESTTQRIAPHRYLMKTMASLREARDRLRWGLTRRLGSLDRKVVDHTRRLERSSPIHMIAWRSQQLPQRAEMLESTLRHRMSLSQERVQRLENVLSAMSYKSVLGRGFSITRTKKGRHVVRSVDDLKDRQRVLTELADGEFEADVVNLKQLELFE